MKKLKLSIIIDTFFLFVLLFLVWLVWLRFWIHNNSLCTTLSLLLSFVLTTIIIFFKLKQNEQNIAIQHKKNILNNLSIYLRILSINDTLSLLSKALIEKGYYDGFKIEKIKVLSNKIILNQNIVLVPFFDKEYIEDHDVLTIIKKQKKNSINYILTINTDKVTNSQIIPQLSNLKLFNLPTLYDQLLENSEFNIPVYEKTKQKLNFKIILYLTISRKKVKVYLLCGLSLLFFSFVVRYNIFYIVEASILCLLAILSYFLPQKNTAV